MDYSTPGFPIHHQLPKLTQTHVHRASDVIQPSHSLSAPFPPAPNLAQHQGLFRWASLSHQVAKVLQFQLQHPMNIQDWFPLGWTGWSPCSPRDSQGSSSTPQFKSISSLALSFLYGPALTSIHDYCKNHSFDKTDLCQQSNVPAFQYAGIAFLPRSNCLLISWLQSPSAVILEKSSYKRFKKG